MCVWFNTKHNFLEKFAFYIFEEMRISLKGAQSSILEKVSCAFESIRWTHKVITKLPFHTIPHSSHLSTLPFVLSITNFQIQTQKKIYNKFPNQLRKKKKNQSLANQDSSKCKMKKKKSNIAKYFKWRSAWVLQTKC